MTNHTQEQAVREKPHRDPGETWSLEEDKKARSESVGEETLEESLPASDPPGGTTVTGIGSPPLHAMPRPESADGNQPTLRQVSLSRITKGEHDALLVAMHALEAALAAAAPGREQAWSTRVHDDLRVVEEALAQHVSSTEAADGLFAEIDVAWPKWLRRVEQLRSEHAELLQQASALRRHVELLWCGEWVTPDFASIRRRAARLLNALGRHQSKEADLIFETFYTDIGAGD